jgi:hypothetical protein
VAGARRVHDGARACAGRLAQVQFVVVFSSISFKKYCPPPLNCAIMLPPLCSPPEHAIMPVMLPPPNYAEIYASLRRTAQPTRVQVRGACNCLPHAVHLGGFLSWFEVSYYASRPQPPVPQHRGQEGTVDAGG